MAVANKKRANPALNFFRKQSCNGEVSIIVFFINNSSSAHLLKLSYFMFFIRYRCTSHRLTMSTTSTASILSVCRVHLNFLHYSGFVYCLCYTFLTEVGMVVVPLHKVNGQRLFVEIQLHFRYVSRSSFYKTNIIILHTIFNRPISNFLTGCQRERIFQPV